MATGRRKHESPKAVVAIHRADFTIWNLVVVAECNAKEIQRSVMCSTFLFFLVSHLARLTA